VNAPIALHATDVVVRRGTAHGSYLLGTVGGPDQFTFRTRDEAVARAIAFAQHAKVAVWIAEFEEPPALLASYRDDAPLSAMT